MTLTTTWPGIILGLHKSTIAKRRSLKSIGCKSYYYRLQHQGRRVRKADVLGLAEESRKIKKDS